MGRRLTAIHEAGHAWGYTNLGRSIIYVTVRARRRQHQVEPWSAGRVVPSPRLIDPYSRSWIAAAGGMAETVWHIRNGVDTDGGVAWVGQFLGRLLASSHQDVPAILPELLDSEQWITVLRTEMEKDWTQIETLAHRLLQAGTVNGAEIRKIFKARSSRR